MTKFFTIIVNFGVFIVSLLSTDFIYFSGVFIVDFEQAIAGRAYIRSLRHFLHV